MGKQIPIIYIDDRIYIPEDEVDVDKAERLYRKRLYDDGVCQKCEFKPERHSEVCDSCDSFLGDHKLYKDDEYKGKPMVSVPVGNKTKLAKLVKLKDFCIIDNRHLGKPITKYGMKFKTKSLYPYQRKAVRVLLEKGRGLLVSAPRTGKTVMATGVILKKQVKTLVLVHQEDLIKQFLKTLRNPLFTNIADREEELERELVSWCKTYEDFAKTPIAFATYQTFLSKKGRKLLKKVVDLGWGIVFIDEVHRANAGEYSKVVNSFKCKHRYGMTATRDRKDCLPSGTLIRTEQGLKPIETIVCGERVHSRTETGNLEWQPVVKTHSRPPGKKLVKVTHAKGTLIATEDHEVWCENRNAYVRVKDLTSQDILLVEG